MINNDQGTHHLLIWINQQQIQIQPKHRIYSFQQIKQSHIIPTILNKVSSTYFYELAKIQFSFKEYLLSIEKYFNQIEDLTLKKTYKQQLIQTQSISQLIKLMLYLIMKSKKKDQFVNRILQLEEETQRYLMQQIKRVHGCLQNKMEFDQIYQTISQIEQQNEILTKRLVQIQMKCKEASNVRVQLQQESMILEQQNRRNINEKNWIIEQLSISRPNDYTSIYKDIITQRNQLALSHSQSQQINHQISQQNSEMRQKIVQDTLIIDHLNHQISKYKQIYSRLKGQNQPNYQDKQQLLKSCQTTLSSTQMIKDLGRDQNISIQSFLSTPCLQFDEEMSVIMHNYNEDLMSKLQAMYSRIGKLNQQITSLKAQNKKIKRESRNKQKIISSALQQHCSHTANYEETIHA